MKLDKGSLVAQARVARLLAGLLDRGDSIGQLTPIVAELPPDAVESVLVAIGLVAEWCAAIDRDSWQRFFAERALLLLDLADPPEVPEIDAFYEILGGDSEAALLDGDGGMDRWPDQ